MGDFVNLRCKIGDFLNETERITFDFDDRNYAKQAMYMKHGAFAIADYGTIQYLPEYIYDCKVNKIKLICGIEFTFVPNLLHSKKIEDLPKVTLLAKDTLGYKTIVKIANFLNDKTVKRELYIDIGNGERNIRADKLGIKYLSDRKLRNLLPMVFDGIPLICIINTDNKVLNGFQLKIFNELVGSLHSMFGKKFYVGLNDDNYKFIMDNIHNVQFVWNPIVRCIRNRKKPKELTELRKFMLSLIEKTQDNEILDDKEYTEHFRNRHEVYKAGLDNIFDNTGRIAESCVFDIEDYYKNLDSNCSKEELRLIKNNDDNVGEIKEIGLKDDNMQLYGKTWSFFEYNVICYLECLVGKLDEEYLKRLEIEFEYIKKFKKEQLFLCAKDIVEKMTERKVEIGNGKKVSSSLVAYSLGITKLDPVKYELDVEPFLKALDSNSYTLTIEYIGNRRSDISNSIKDTIYFDNLIECFNEEIEPYYVEYQIKEKVIKCSSKFVKNEFLKDDERFTHIVNPKGFKVNSFSNANVTYIFRPNIDYCLPIAKIEDDRQISLYSGKTVKDMNFDLIEFRGV